MNRIVYLDDYKKSQHSFKRSQQRSVKNKVLVDVLNYSDKEENCGKGCMRHIVTKKRQISLLKEKVITPAQAEKIKNIAVITKDNTIITVFHAYKKFWR